MEKKKLTMNYDTRERRFSDRRKKVYAIGLALIFGLLISSFGGLCAADPADRELRYAVTIGDAPAGWMVTRKTFKDDRRVTESELHLEIRRAGVSQSLGMQSRFEETADHRPLRAVAEQRLGLQPMRTEYLFGGEDGRVKVVAGGQERQVPLPGGSWLTPFAAQEATSREMARVLGAPEPGKSHFEITLLDPSLGLQSVTTRWTLVDSEVEVLVDGEPRQAARWSQRPEYAPGLETIADVTPEGDVLRSVTPIMGMEMVMTLTSRSVESIQGRQGAATAGRRAAPEMLRPSFLRPDRKIEHPRRLRSARYRLLFDGSMPPLPQAGAQRSESMDGGARVTVSLSAPHEVSEIDRELYLRATDFLQHQEPLLRKLASGVKPGPNGGERDTAEGLRRLVAEHLRAKNLDSVMASALEAARNGAGDCTEHAMLLAALLRAEGIPSRVVSGMIYMDRFAGEEDLFGYHMWTQAWIDGRWIDLDATLGDRQFDAAHIALATSPLADSGSALMDLASAGPLIGRLRIEVEDLSWSDPVPWIR